MPNPTTPSEIRPTTAAGRAGLTALLADPERALVGFDFDGTLSPIVEDPALARAEPGGTEVLATLAGKVGRVAIVTGRPTRTVVELAALDAVDGLERLVVLGQYGVERWDAATGRHVGAPPPAGLDVVRRDLADVLRAVGVEDAVVEDKGLAVAVHVRRSAAPEAAFARLVEPLRDLAERVDLSIEPGRLVIEIRPPGMDKGKALLALAVEIDAQTVVFTGDDLGDLAAFDAVEAWRATGGAGLLVCSGSDEVEVLAARADLVVDGPRGVLELMRRLIARLA